MYEFNSRIYTTTWTSLAIFYFKSQEEITDWVKAAIILHYHAKSSYTTDFLQ